MLRILQWVVMHSKVHSSALNVLHDLINIYSFSPMCTLTHPNSCTSAIPLLKALSGSSMSSLLLHIVFFLLELPFTTPYFLTLIQSLPSSCNSFLTPYA